MMKKIYIASLSLIVSGLLFFVFANISFAAGVCGEEPYPHCDDLCVKFPENTSQYDACYDPCYSEYLAADDKYRACQQAEYDKYVAVYEEKSNYEDQKAAAEKTRQDEETACNKIMGDFAKEDLKCTYACHDSYDACYTNCWKQDHSDSATSACVAKACTSVKAECTKNCDNIYYKDCEEIVFPCLDAAADKFNQKMDLINRHDWPALQGILDEEDKLAEEKKFTDEKARLESARAENPDLTTISTDGSTAGRGVAVQKPDGSWKTVYAETDIEEGDVIYTKNNSATINYSDGSKINLGPGSSVKYGDSKILMQLRVATENIVEKKINLLRGKIKLWGNKLEIRTPNAVLADRGTEFIVDYNPDAKITTAYLYDGILDVSNLKNEIKELNKGETITVDSSGKMILGTLEQEKWVQLSGEITSPKSAQQGATGQSSGKTAIWLIPAGVLICIIGAVLFVRRKR